MCTKSVVFESFSASANAAEGRPLMSLEVPWDVLGVPGVRPWSTMGILAGSWSHLGEGEGVPEKPFGCACGTLAMLESNEKPLDFDVFSCIRGT